MKTNPNNTSDPSGNENKSGRSDGGSSLATVSLSSLRKQTPLSLCWQAAPPLCGGEGGGGRCTDGWEVEARISRLRLDSHSPGVFVDDLR